MTEIETNVHQLDAAYKPFPTFAEWAAKTSVETVRWDRYNASVKELSRQSPVAFDRAREIATRAAAIDTGAIENLYEADRGFTYTVAFQTGAWENAVAARGEQVRPLFEAQLRGYELVLTLATGAEPISEAAIRELHVEMCSAQETYRVMTAVGPQEQPLPKGRYKSLPNHVRTRDGENHSYAPVDVTPEEMYRLVGEVRSEAFGRAHPVIQAAYAHYCLVVIHPFADGNGRVARAVASAFTYRAISMPILILSEQKTSYLDALEAADSGNYQAFVKFMLARSLDTIELVDESLKANQSTPSAKTLDSLTSLYETKGGFTQDQVDAAGLKLSELIRQELGEKVPKTSVHKVTIGFDHIGSGVPPAPNVRHTLSKMGGFQVTLRTAAPAAAVVTRSFGLFVPKDAGEEDDLQLRQIDGNDIFSARMEDLSPEPTGVLRIRAGMFAERVFADLVSQLRERAEQQLRS